MTKKYFFLLHDTTPPIEIGLLCKWNCHTKYRPKGLFLEAPKDSSVHSQLCLLCFLSFFYFLAALQDIWDPMGSYGNPYPLHWKCDILTSGPLGNSQVCLLWIYLCLLNYVRPLLLSICNYPYFSFLFLITVRSEQSYSNAFLDHPKQ